MFDILKKSKTYKTNITLQQLGLFDQFDRNVALILKNKSIDIDGAIHMCVTQGAFEKKVINLKKDDDKAEYEMVQVVLGMALDNVIQQEEYRALIIHGLLDNEIVIQKEDLMELKDVVDSFCIMYAAARNKLPNEKAYEFMKGKTVYVFGNLPNINMKKGMEIKIPVIKRESERGQYESVKCFLTLESAEKFNDTKEKVSAVNVQDLVKFYNNVFGVIIEPHRNYWIEFNADNAKLINKKNN